MRVKEKREIDAVTLTAAVQINFDRAVHISWGEISCRKIVVVPQDGNPAHKHIYKGDFTTVPQFFQQRTGGRACAESPVDRDIQQLLTISCMTDRRRH